MTGGPGALNGVPKLPNSSVGFECCRLHTTAATDPLPAVVGTIKMLPTGAAATVITSLCC